MTACDFTKVLLAACPAVYHDEISQEPNECIRWSEVGENSLRAEGTAEIADRIAVDFFTKNEFSEIPDLLRAAFDKSDISYDDPEISYDEDTGYKHYAYTVEVY